MSRRLRYACVLLAVGAAVSVTPTAASAAPSPDLQIARERTSDLITMVDGSPATFSGVMFDEAAGVATVQYPARAGREGASGRLRALAAPAKAAGAGSAAESWRVSFAPVTYSLAELGAVRRQVETDAAWQRLAGPLLSKWYVDTANNKVVVGLTKVTPAVREFAARRFGTMVELQTAARVQRLSRFDDAEPYHAGVRLEFPDTDGRCTAGFTIRSVRNPDIKRMVTAGHCAPTGAVVENNRQAFGTVDFSQSNGLDVAYISGRTYFPGTYVGQIFEENVRDVAGGWVAGVNMIVCANGSFTGERCTGKIVATNACTVVIGGTRVCHLNEMRPIDGRRLAQPGDSGGPVHAYSARGGLCIAGSIVAGDAVSTFYHPYGVIMPSGWTLDNV